MTVYVGVDIAKELHYAAIMNDDGVVSNPFSFENNDKGFQSLLSHLAPFEKESVLVGYESTAHYQENLAYFLKREGYRTAELNPLQTSALRKANIRNTKTDRVDAKLICLTLAQHNAALSGRDVSRLDDLYGLCRMRMDLITKRTQCKIQFVAIMDRIFPELATFFKGNLHINTAYRLIEKYPLPSQIKKTRIDVLTSLFQKASKGRYGRDKAAALKKLASVSVGIPSDTFAFQAQQLIHQIEFYSDQIAAVDQKIDSDPVVTSSLLMTIPGISSYACACILSVIKNINDFHGPCKILAYAGLDPVIRQSGKFNARSTRMSKRGNSLLRYSLIWTAGNVVLNNATFAAYYAKKISEGKSHYQALGHCAKKLVKSIFHVLKYNEAFNLA
jgi:transposase